MHNNTNKGQEIRRRVSSANSAHLPVSVGYQGRVRKERKNAPLGMGLNNPYGALVRAYDSGSLPYVAMLGLAASVVLYFYMVVSIVFVTVERKHFEEQVREYTTELSFTETTYGQKLGEVTLASAEDSGYINAESSFAKKIDSGVLTLNR